MMERVKAKLRAGEVVSMVNPGYPAPGLVERIGLLGFDIAFIDCERFSYGTERIEEMARAGRAGGVATVLRPWSNDAGLISRYLDLGVDGVMAASIDDVAAATALVEAVRFARHDDFDRKLVVGMIESPAAIDNLDGLMAVDGIDVWVIGANDLAHRMGHPGRAATTPEVQEVIAQTIARVTGAGRVCGINVKIETAQRFIGLGVRFVITDANYLLEHGSAAYRRALAG